MLQSVDATVGLIYQSTGRTDILFKWGIGSGIIAIIVFIIGLKWGIIGVAAGYMIYSFALFIPGLYIPFKLIKLKVYVFLENLLRIFLISISMGVIVYSTGFIIKIPGILELIIKSIISVMLYVSFNYFFNKKMISEIFAIVRKIEK